MQNWKGYPKRLWHLHPWRFSDSAIQIHIRSIVLQDRASSGTMDLQRSWLTYTISMPLQNATYKTWNSQVFSEQNPFAKPPLLAYLTSLFSERWWTKKLWVCNMMGDSTTTWLSKQTFVPKGWIAMPQSLSLTMQTKHKDTTFPPRSVLQRTRPKKGDSSLWYSLLDFTGGWHTPTSSRTRLWKS